MSSLTPVLRDPFCKLGAVVIVGSLDFFRLSIYYSVLWLKWTVKIFFLKTQYFGVGGLMKFVAEEEDFS